MTATYVFRNDPKGTETSPGVHGGSRKADNKPSHGLHERLSGLQRKIGNRALGRLLAGWIQREQGPGAGEDIPSALMDESVWPHPSGPDESPAGRFAERHRFNDYQSLTLNGFAVNSATLTEDHRTAISENGPRFANLIRRHPDGVVVITGYGDLTGPARDPEGYNERLGMERAEAVARAMNQVPAEAVRTESGGWSNPVVPEPGYNPLNRRVEIVFRRLTTGGSRLLEPFSSQAVTPPSDLEAPAPGPVRQEVGRIVAEEIAGHDPLLLRIRNLPPDVGVYERARQFVEYFVSRLVRDTLGRILQGGFGSLLERLGVSRQDAIEGISEAASEAAVDALIEYISESAAGIFGRDLSPGELSEMRESIAAFVESAARWTSGQTGNPPATSELTNQSGLIDDLNRILADDE